MRQCIYFLVLVFILSPSISFPAPSKKWKPDPKFDLGEYALEERQPFEGVPQKQQPKFLKDKSIVCPALKKQFIFLVRGRNFTPKNEAWRISRFFAAARVAEEAIRAVCW